MLECYSSNLDLRAQSSIKNSGEKSGKSPKREFKKKIPVKQNAGKIKGSPQMAARPGQPKTTKNTRAKTDKNAKSQD